MSRDIGNESEAEIHAVDTLSDLDKNDVILDIRSPDEQEESPLVIENIVVKHLPFYKISSQFSQLDQTKQYLLYCDHGVMSKLQTLYLHDLGFVNVKVYRP